jgi:hypothetical protein
MKILATRFIAPAILGCALVLLHTTSASAAQQLCVNGNTKTVGNCQVSTPGKTSEAAHNVIAVKAPVFLSAAAVKNNLAKDRIQLAFCGPTWCP